MNTSMSRGCPGCGSSNIRHSRRRGIEQFAPWFGLLAFRCNRCLAIFFKSLPEPTGPQSAPGLQKAT